MQTFLPYLSFQKSAACLDNNRLGKQRVEAWQIYKALTDPAYGWRNHPAVQMWRGHEQTLLLYGVKVCQEWRSRGFKDTMLERFTEKHNNCRPDPLPPWLGLEAFHASHRAALLFKDPIHYGQFGWSETPAVPDSKGSLPYYWPTKQGGV